MINDGEYGTYFGIIGNIIFVGFLKNYFKLKKPLPTEKLHVQDKCQRKLVTMSFTAERKSVT